MRRSPILNAITDATFEQVNDPSVGRFIRDGWTWHNPDTGETLIWNHDDWESLNDGPDSTQVGELWFNPTTRTMHEWDGSKWVRTDRHF